MNRDMRQGRLRTEIVQRPATSEGEGRGGEREGSDSLGPKGKGGNKMKKTQKTSEERECQEREKKKKGKEEKKREYGEGRPGVEVPFN